MKVRFNVILRHWTRKYVNWGKILNHSHAYLYIHTYIPKWHTQIYTHKQHTQTTTHTHTTHMFIRQWISLYIIDNYIIIHPCKDKHTEVYIQIQLHDDFLFGCADGKSYFRLIWIIVIMKNVIYLVTVNFMSL